MKLYFYLLMLLINNSSGNTLISAFLNILDLYAYEVLDSGENETECIKQLKLYHEDLKVPRMYAAKMFDSSGKIQPGILTGNVMFVGNYDECLDINEIRNGSLIKGQYCRTDVITTEESSVCVNQNFIKKYSLSKNVLAELERYLKIRWDGCFPAVCSAKELQSLWDFAEKHYDVKCHVLFSDTLCSSVEKENEYSTLTIIIISLFALIGAICVFSTLYDVFIYQKQKQKVRHYLIAFSYYTNGKKLFTIKSKESDESELTCLGGIKTISMIWIVLGHRFLLNYAGTSINTVYSLEWFTHEPNMFLMGSFAGVDSFFVISGCLIIYVIMSAHEKGIGINLFTFYIHRFLRLSPALIAIVLVYMGIFNHLGAGPYWNLINSIMVEPCRENWWHTIIYIENYLEPEARCLVQSWYLAVDTQLYLLSPLIFIPLLKWPKFTISTIVGLILTSIGLTVRATYVHNISRSNLKAKFDYYMYIYSPTELRMGPWLVGLVLGYIIFKTKDRKIIKINKILVLFLWMLSIALMLFIMYLYVFFFKYKFTLPMIASFFSLSRVVWGISLSWIIFSCARGTGGFLNTFLSLPIFNILGRLTYSMYLTHLLVIDTVEAQRRTPAYADNLMHMHHFWGDYMFTIVLSIIWCLTFESPVKVLEKSMFAKGNKNTLHIQKMDNSARPKNR